MTGHEVKITTKGPVGRIEVDGVDISDAVKLGAVLRLPVDRGEAAVLSLDLMLWRHETAAADVRLQMPEATREALIVLGWTPPGGDQP